jgi:hypothetical protein
VAAPEENFEPDLQYRRLPRRRICEQSGEVFGLDELIGRGGIRRGSSQEQGIRAGPRPRRRASDARQHGHQQHRDDGERC